MFAAAAKLLYYTAEMPSDDDDVRLFRFLHPQVVNTILRIKRNDPGVKSLRIGRVDCNEALCRRLGYYLGQNTRVNEVFLEACVLDVTALCAAGLKHNEGIQTLCLYGTNLRGNGHMASLAPFLTNNLSLIKIDLNGCNLGTDCIDILSTALLNRQDDTLKELDLGGNHFGDIDLDRLFLALRRSRTLKMLSLTGNETGRRGIASLARLLKHEGSNLEGVYLINNFLDNECAIMLADSLKNNATLQMLDIRQNHGITAKGWSAVLKLVCDNSTVDGVIESNHTLNNVGILIQDYRRDLDAMLGIDGGNLLRALLEINEESDKMLVIRRKILWSHVRGNCNLGDSSIFAGVMPRVLAWIGNDSNTTNANLIQYHDPPLPNAKLDNIRLDAMFRIIISNPDLCKNNGINRRNRSLPAISMCLAILGLVLSMVYLFSQYS